jgi:translation initiation factor 2A
MVTGEVQFWESKNVGKGKVVCACSGDVFFLIFICGISAVWARLKVEGIAQYSLSPGKAPAIAVFVPEKKVN